jgi:ribulose-5-phosphate 4-epimerase/fuculose-1-phosphate aldolase
MDLVQQTRDRAASALHRVVSKGLVGNARAWLSVRVPGKARFVALASDGERNESPVRSLDETQNTSAETAIHAAIYRLRPDMGAILVASPVWGSKLTQVPAPMPGLFDEQARQLGGSVERLVFGPNGFAAGSVRILKKGAHCYLYGERAICSGITAERLALNAEIFEKCAKAYLLATLSGLPVHTIPRLIRWIAGRRLRRDQARAIESFRRGEWPSENTNY